jgi:hypothetical protein
MPTSKRLDAIEEALDGLARQPPSDGTDPTAPEAALWRDPDYAALLGSPPDDSIEPWRLAVHRRLRPAALVRTDADVARLVGSIEAERRVSAPWIGEAATTWDDVARVLKHDPDRSRREAAWFAAVPLAAAIEPDVQRLMQLRNERAARLQDDSFPVLALAADELTVLEFMTWCDELEPLTRPAFEQMLAWMQRENGGETLEPWDVEYWLARLEPAPDAIRPIGLARMEEDFAFPPTPPGAPASEPAELDAAGRFEHWADLGGRFHRKFRPNDPPAAGWTTGAWNEAMRRLVGESMATEPILDRPGTLADRAWIAWRQVYALRRLMAASLFELLAYESPGADLHGLWCEIHEHYLGFPRHPERLWAAEPRFVSDPLSGAGVVVGCVLAAQLAERMLELHPHLLTPETGLYLRAEVWEPGARETVEAATVRLTGRIPDPDAWVRAVTVASPD